MLGCIRSPVFDWWLGLAITRHHNVAVTAGLMMLRPLSVALCVVELRSLNFCGERLKVGVYDVRGWELLVVVLEDEFVLTLLWHLHPDSRLADASTLRPVGLQQILP